jgi:hypothetical protein
LQNEKQMSANQKREGESESDENINSLSHLEIQIVEDQGARDLKRQNSRAQEKKFVDEILPMIESNMKKSPGPSPQGNLTRYKIHGCKIH